MKTFGGSIHTSFIFLGNHLGSLFPNILHLFSSTLKGDYVITHSDGRNLAFVV